MRLIAIVFILAGCVEEGADPDQPSSGTLTRACEPGAPSLTLGTGDYEHHTLYEGDPVTVVAGPQGAWHVALSGAVQHTGQEVVIQGSMHEKDTGESVAHGPETLMALSSYDDATCAGRFFGIRAIIETERPPPGGFQDFVCGMEGRELQIVVSIEDMDTGQSATESVTVVAEIDDPGCP